jgi:hydroxymethylpyrimidine pyrophosphatase-like HAD family hydrolase
LFKTILFDLDGTLTDPAAGITNSFIHALEYFGIEIPSYEKLCSFIGPPLPSTFEKEFGFTGEKNDLAVKKYREHFATKGLFENTVYEGIPQLLQTLKEKGFELIVATSKPEQYSVQILDHFNLSKYFDFICDDNGLYSNNNFVSAIDCGGLVMLVGNLIICNHDAEGNEISLTQEEIEYIVKNHIRYRIENENEYKPIITDMEGWFTK